MVQQLFDPYDRFPGGSPQRGDDYPKISVADRLDVWFRKVTLHSTFMRSKKNETLLQLKRKLAAALNLNSSEVIIREEETRVYLLSTSRTEPLAVIEK